MDFRGNTIKAKNIKFSISLKIFAKTLKHNDKACKFLIGSVRVQGLIKMKEQLTFSKYFSKWTLMTHTIVIFFLFNK